MDCSCHTAAAAIAAISRCLGEIGGDAMGVPVRSDGGHKGATLIVGDGGGAMVFTGTKAACNENIAVPPRIWEGVRGVFPRHKN